MPFFENALLLNNLINLSGSVYKKKNKSILFFKSIVFIKSKERLISHFISILFSKLLLFYPFTGWIAGNE